jgi:hypothetical protein
MLQYAPAILFRDAFAPQQSKAIRLRMARPTGGLLQYSVWCVIRLTTITVAGIALMRLSYATLYRHPVDL